MDIVAFAGVLVPIFSVLGAFCMVIFLRKFQNAERMAMIEKGLSPILPKEGIKINPSSTLRFSLLAMGAGVGIVAGHIFERYTGETEPAYFSMILIFGGLGLLISYFYELKIFKKLKEREKMDTENTI